jgi:hypothetical protein
LPVIRTRRLALAAGLLLGAVLAPGSTRAQAPADSARAVPAAPADSLDEAPADSGIVDTVALGTRFYEYIAHPFLQALTMPVELVLVPAVRAAIYPAKPPIRYMLDHDVIDRTIELISFGEREQIMIYPTLNLAPGTGSYTGLSLRHRSLFGRPTERLVAMGNIYVNGDWKFRTYLTASEMLGTGLSGKFSLQFNRIKNTSIYQPGRNVTYAYADTSNVLYFQLAHRLLEKVSGRATYVFRDNHFGKAPPGGDSLASDFFRNEEGVLDPASRGLEKDWQDHIVSLGVFRDTRNNEHITLAGSDFGASWRYHFNREKHNFTAWEATWTGYYKLGKERYEITADEERQAGPTNIRSLLKQLEIRKLGEQMFNRKVVALHVYAAQSFEVGGGNRMPAYGLATLGNLTPLRGYGGSRFRDYAVASIGGEYRFPVLRLMDGLIFNEYGVYGRSWDGMDWLGSLKNSWGFGVNVRRPDIFLFRLHLGFHGLHGIQINMSVDAPY